MSGSRPLLPGRHVQPGLLPDEQLAPSQSRITLRAEEKALRVTCWGPKPGHLLRTAFLWYDNAPGVVARSPELAALSLSVAEVGCEALSFDLALIFFFVGEQ